MNENGLTVVSETRDLVTFDRDKINLIKQTVARGATDQQLALFLHQAQRTGLDPLSRQIHCILRKNNRTGKNDMSIQVAIDGYRLIADRTGLYAGSDDYLFNDGLTQYQHLTHDEQFPVTSTVTVYKIVAGIRVPFTATAQWDAYYPGQNQGFMWRKMPYLMLGKCAEALALRKAFPAELSGVYVREEMEQAGFVEVEEKPGYLYDEEDIDPGPDIDPMGNHGILLDSRGEMSPNAQQARDTRHKKQPAAPVENNTPFAIGDGVSFTYQDNTIFGDVKGINGDKVTVMVGSKIFQKSADELTKIVDAPVE